MVNRKAFMQLYAVNGTINELQSTRPKANGQNAKTKPKC